MADDNSLKERLRRIAAARMEREAKLARLTGRVAGASSRFVKEPRAKAILKGAAAVSEPWAKVSEKIAYKIKSSGNNENFDAPRFHKYLENLRASKKPNAGEYADELEANFVYWKKNRDDQGNERSDEEAIQRSFESFKSSEKAGRWDRQAGRPFGERGTVIDPGVGSSFNPNKPRAKQRANLIIESFPVQGISIDIYHEVKGETITLELLQQRYPEQRLPQVAETIFSIVVNFRSVKGQFGEDEEAAAKYLMREINSTQLPAFRIQAGELAGFIIEREFIKNTEKAWKKEKFKTNLYTHVPAGRYIISIPDVNIPEVYKKYKFSKWIKSSPDQKTESKNKIEVYVSEGPGTSPTILMAEFSSTEGVQFSKRSSFGSPGRAAVSETHGGLSTNSFVNALGVNGLRQRIGRVVDPRKSSIRSGEVKEEYTKNPHFLAAVNKGKRILNQYGKLEYDRIFGDFKKTWQYEKEQINIDKKAKQADFKNAQSAAKTAKKKLDGMKKDDPGYSAALAAYQEALQSERDAFLKIRDIELGMTFAKKFNDDLERRSVTLKNALTDRADTIAKLVCRRFQIPLGSEDQAAVKSELTQYASDLAEDFAARGKTFRHAFMRGLGIASRSTQTFGSAGMNVLQSTWDLIFGPWTWTTILVVLQFFFILTYVGYNIYYLWIFPIIGALFTFMMNFSDSFKPLDWWTHLMSGANIGYSALLLLIALDALDWTGGSYWFWIVWAVVGFIGIMQFYQIGGWRVILQGAIIVLVFAWIALGPYSAYYQQALDQIKTPVEIVYNGIKDAFTNIWLLATNPTEFYARQQVINIRPERPVDLEKGVEVTLFEALPQSVPAGQEFGLTAVLTNEGVINESAKEIRLNFSCNQWCESRSAEPVGLSDEERLRSRLDLNPKVFFIDNEMTRGDATSVNIRGFKALGDNVRVGETRIAKVTFNVAYNYSSSSSLLTEVMGQEEVDRRLQNREDLFKNVLAVAKLSPAQLSLNVGPQPLISNSEAKSLLLVSVFSTRDDGIIRLPAGTRITITLPRTIGFNLNCDNNPPEVNDNKEVLQYVIPNDVEILSRKFNSIFSFICTFNPQPIADIKADLITAELPNYVFILKKEKDIPVTPPVGIIFDPYEKVCNTCGVGERNNLGEVLFDHFQECDVEECTVLTNQDSSKGQVGICYYEFAGTGRIQYLPDVPTPQTLWGNPCHSCSKTDDCGDFLTPQTCGSQSSLCGLNCKWDETASNPSMLNLPEEVRNTYLDPNPGACVKSVVSGQSIDTTGSLACKDISQTYRTKYNKYKDIIETAIKTHKLDEVIPAGEDARALVAAVIEQESGWVESSQRTEPATATRGPVTSYSLMQIIPEFHPKCNAAKIKSKDIEENINCGVRFLADIAKSYKTDGSRTYYCANGVSGSQINYAGVDAMFRWYNGWPPAGGGQCSGTPKYVPEAKAKYSKWRGCFQSPAAGSDNYCSERITQTGLKCDFGYGTCQNSGECSTIQDVDNLGNKYSLECKDPGIGKSLCCYPPKTPAGETAEQANLRCITKFNQLTGTG